MKNLTVFNCTLLAKSGTNPTELSFQEWFPRTVFVYVERHRGPMKTYAGVDLHSSNNYIGVINTKDEVKCGETKSHIDIEGQVYV